MIATKAKKSFKKRFGQANHLLITALVGLNAIETGLVTKKPDGFNTSWNPRAPARSAERARIFTLKSFLGWAVESLEMYLTELNRKPKELESEELASIYSKAGQSIYKKTIWVGEHAKVDPVLIALMEVLITWRNYTFHYDIDNTIRSESVVLLRNSADRLREEFCGLEIDQLQETWKNQDDFTFKETASLINATHKYVSAVDAFAITQINKTKYMTDALELHFRSNKKAIQKLRSLPHEKKIRFIKSITTDLVGVDVFKEGEAEQLLESVYGIF
jgi:hypothetical protein